MNSRQYGAPKNAMDRGNAYATQGGEPKPKPEDPSPDGKTVELFHKNAEVDTRRESIHHTLGSSPNQASPGAHVHDGSDSMLLLEGYTITGQVANPNTVLPSIINALVRLGAEDGTS